MDLYQIVYNGLTDDEIQAFEGIYGVSIVDSPANEKLFIKLSKDVKIEVKMANQEKKLLTGVVLIPNQKIYRVDANGYEYEIFFDEDTIEKLSQDFLTNGYQRNTSYNHNDDEWLKGTSIVQSWIIEESNNDRANALGFKDLPKGTWMITMKLSDELWDQYIQTGKAKGFSIDAFLDMQKIKMNNNKKNKTKKKMSLFKKLRMALASTLMSEITIDGMGVLVSDNFEVGDEVFFNNELLVSQTFEYEGFVYVTDEEGVISSKEPKQEEQETEVEIEPIVEEVALEELPADIVGDVMVATEEIEEEVLQPVEDIDVEALKAKIAELEAKIEEISQQKEMMVSENVSLKEKLSNKPNTTKLSAVVNKQPETRMERIARLAKLGQK
jgi:hypothetical protein